MASDLQIGAVFGDRPSAEAAVDALRAAGLADEHLGVAVREPDLWVFEEDGEADIGGGIEAGIVMGAPIGAIAGMAILALVIPGVGTVGIGGVLLAGGVTGAMAGTYLGGLLGLVAEEESLNEEFDWERLDLGPGQVLIVVSGHGRPDTVANLLQLHGGRLVHKPVHVA